ncbi:MAG TPA: C1 family peptidase [Terriglobales bacterium]|nr:C1 family peptidase [Terriglobales bacterium]
MPKTRSTEKPSTRKRQGKPLRSHSNRPVLDARPDTIDFRDQMYVATLTEVPTERPLADYKKAGVPILDQGAAGACAGFGLATVANYLLRKRKIWPDKTGVSPWMLYAMAQVSDPHDESAAYGQAVNPDVGASCRSAMKGWNQNGVCQANYFLQSGACKPSAQVVVDARLRPLGAYFRVNHKDLVAMHTALQEVGILYVSALVHEGWFATPRDGKIPHVPGVSGGHAFAIVGYDKSGFWIQNSWGAGWGARGFGYLSYDDWLENGTDAWVARLGVPVELQKAASSATINTTNLQVQSSGYAVPELAPHVISIGDGGILKTNGQWAKTASQVQDIFTTEFPAATSTWAKKRLVLYAHGGLVSEDTAVNRIGWYWSNLKWREMYLVGFVWHTDYLSTLEEILHDVITQIRPEGAFGTAKDFLLDRLDDTLEPIARVASGKMEWDKMKSKAMGSTQGQNGGARIAANGIKSYFKTLSAVERANFEIHIVGHSAGSIFLAPLIQFIGSLGLRIETCTLWAPACTVDVFAQYYVPAIGSTIKKFSLFTLDDTTERADNCADIYHKSLLYLVSDAFETHFRVPLIHPDGEPLLGMDNFVSKNGVMSGTATAIAQWLSLHGADWIKSPNENPKGSRNAATAKHHGDFSTDEAVLLATIARVAGVANVPVAQPIGPPTSPPSLIPPFAKTNVNELRRNLLRT